MRHVEQADQRWRAEASRVLKARLARCGLSYAELVSRLNAKGASESYAGVANKVSRGTFSFAFYLQCISVIDEEGPLGNADLYINPKEF
ncbi:DUF6471 domain-containing protein [Xanthomonas sacchari]|uniref:DUF6471 domain-containing protein n=1 Tax=Xanthomonas sacchari TaxID=56458 RepID=UPI003D187A15